MIVAKDCRFLVGGLMIMDWRHFVNNPFHSSLLSIWTALNSEGLRFASFSDSRALSLPINKCVISA